MGSNDLDRPSETFKETDLEQKESMETQPSYFSRQSKKMAKVLAV